LRFLVSGAAGFIGSHLSERLANGGHEVVGLDNLITGSRDNVEALLEQKRFSLQIADVTREFGAVGPFDAVLHLASLASPKHYLAHPLETLESGSEGTRRMIEVALRDNARFLLASTSECYGDPEVHPQVETYWGNVNPVGPRSCYDESKRYAEALTMAYQRTRGLRSTIARIFNTYGPRMALDDGRVVPQFIDQALRGEPLTVYGDGSQTRSFCYVRDLVDGLLLLLNSEEHDPVNLGNPHEMTILEFSEYVRQAVNPALQVRFEPLPKDDPRRRRPDITKARTILGWEPRVSLEEGIRETIRYFQSRVPVSR
jgi:dTDP-glucose 4,6-dehydratase